MAPLCASQGIKATKAKSGRVRKPKAARDVSLLACSKQLPPYRILAVTCRVESLIGMTLYMAQDMSAAQHYEAAQGALQCDNFSLAIKHFRQASNLEPQVALSLIHI